MAFAKSQLFSADLNQIAIWAKALGHPARISILEYLVNHRGCICNDLVDDLPLSQSTISQHLKALRDAGLIKGEIDGARICYCIDEETVRRFRTALEGLFSNLKCC